MDTIADTLPSPSSSPEASSSSSSSSCGGAIAGSIFGTIICILLLLIGAWWLYKKYYKNKSGGPLVTDDAENAKVDYAFDNPAFRGDHNKNTSPFDNKWKSSDKRKTLDDSFAGAPMPRLVPLRGSDFTGLGIEVCGGLKDGIYVKKVMPQGPAAGIVNRGDKITSITIDFRHIVQEDAATILSYASPYNVQLELVEGKGTLPNTLSQSPSPQSLTHPLYRSSSQEDFNTIERNARRKLFSNDDNSYPTLKMDQHQPIQHQKPRSPSSRVHEEHEKKNSLKKFQHFIDMVEEKFQTKSSQHSKHQTVEKVPSNGSNQSTDDGKKSLKFGIRVLPPNVNDKEFGKSPSKVQVENDNNMNIEKIEIIEKTGTPPEVCKRTKNRIEEIKPVIEEENRMDFRREGSVNASGIRRDAAGIPQEMPNEMMQAALAARDNRKQTNGMIEKTKSKGKAPRPPSAFDYDMNESTDTMMTNVSIDVPDCKLKTHITKASEKLNFTDNFSEDMSNKSDSITEFEHLEKSTKGPSNSSTPRSDRKKNASDTESQNAQDHDSDVEIGGKGVKHIELNSKHITVHQTSEEESDNEGRRTASLGDLSKLEFTACPSGNRSNTGTLERAQSLEISDANSPVTVCKVTPKKRKAPMNETTETNDFKEPRLSEPIIDSLDTIQHGRLKSAYEWGNLEDAIYDKKENGNASDTESLGNATPEKKISTGSMDMMSEVLAAADKFEREINDIQLNDVIEIVERVKIEERGEIPEAYEIKQETTTITWEPPEEEESYETDKIESNNYANAIDDTRRFIEEECLNGFYSEPSIKEISPVMEKVEHIEANQMERKLPPPRRSIEKVESPTRDMDQDEWNKQEEDQIRIINNGPSITDDGKVMKYPLASLDRPKSEVLKKLIAEHVPDDDLKLTNGITTTKITSDTDQITVETVTTATRYSEVGPISLTLGGLNESDLTESSQISPVFSSDGQGVNSISISSTESVIRMEPKKEPLPTVLAVDNMVTVTTDDSQPSSIILIDDENLNFTVSTIDDVSESTKAVPPPPPPRTSKDEVFIIESLSSKKVQETPELSNGDQKSPKNFVTEICLRNTNKDHELNLKNLNKTLNEQKMSPDENTMSRVSAIPTARSIQSSTTKITSNNSSASTTPEKPVIVEEEYIPRNSEIKFTTSTYQSPRNFEKRNSHIDQIRSNFERNHNSEIPVPIRKTSAPNTPPPTSSSVRTSPSKIPVFNSQKSSDNLLKNNGNVKTGVSVSITSIKNSSRNPSGK